MIDVKVIADSICKTRITTLAVTMPKFLVAQLNTHRVFSRNSASSRAIPALRVRQQVMEMPYVPSMLPSAQKGMAGGAPLSQGQAEEVMAVWFAARDDAVRHHEMLEASGLAKELCNRVLEPWMLTTVLVTSTEWSNFFNQRLPGHGAQAEMELLAVRMRDSIDASSPRRLLAGHWHLPFCPTVDPANPGQMVKVSAARCARVSYRRHEDVRTFAEDANRHDEMVRLGHWSPFEHIAEAMPGDIPCRNFRGWYQYRALLDGGKR